MERLCLKPDKRKLKAGRRIVRAHSMWEVGGRELGVDMIIFHHILV